MPKTEKKASAIRYRFSVPEDDVSVIQWLKNQNNISSSLRFLVRDAIRGTGMQDVTCVPVEQYAKRGRPSNAELMAREVEKKETGETKSEVAEVPAQVSASVPEPVPEPKPEPVRPAEPVRPEPQARTMDDSIGIVPGLSDAGQDILNILNR